MTNVDVLYRYDAPPRETSVLSLSRLREVYGIRSLALNEADKTVRIEYDATRLTEPAVRQMVLRAGVNVVEAINLAPPAPVAATPAA